MKGLLNSALLFLLLVVCSSAVNAQQKPELSVKDIMAKEQPQEEQPEAKESSSLDNERNLSDDLNEPAIEVPDDEYDRGTPRSTISGYLIAAKARDFATASQFIDYRNLPEDLIALGEEELAKQLIMVLDRALWIDLDNVDDTPKGDLNESVPSYRESLGSITLGNGSIDILLQRVPRKSDRVKIWKISNATIIKLPKLTQEYGYSPMGEWLSERVPNVSFLGVMLWQWLYFILAGLSFYLFAKLLTWLIGFALTKTYRKMSPDITAFIRGPVSLLLAVLLTRAYIDGANKTLAAEAISEGKTLLIVAWCWVFLRLIDLFKVLLAQRFIAQDKPLAVYLLRPAGNVMKSLLVIVAALVWFENLGFSASTLLAGLGIGGLAIALAAQKTVENIIGAITLYTSAPVKIGNFCKFGEQVGFVEEIGLRATRIRTLDRTVVYVANAQFIDMKLENFSERERIAFKPKLNLSTKCKKADIEAFIHDLKETLKSIEIVCDDLLRVNFKGFDAWALQVEVLTYINTTDYEEYLAINESINLTILSLLEKNNCSLSRANDFKERFL